jgi:integrase
MATIRKRGSSWQAQVRREGSPPVSKSFPTKAAASAWARALEAQIDTADLSPSIRDLRTMTVADLLKRYEEEVTPSKRGARYETSRIRFMMGHKVAQERLGSLSGAAVARYRDDRLKTVKAATARRELVILRHVFEVAIKEWNVPLPGNPVRAIKVPKDSEARDRRLEQGELERLLGAIGPRTAWYLRPFIILAIETGMRRGELVSLTWAHVDLKKRTVRLPITKNGHLRIVPLTPKAIEVLSSLERSDARVFPIHEDAVNLAWQRLRAKAGVEGLRLHDLRHEAVSRFFEYGLSIPEVALISGHRDLRMLSRYTHLRPEAVAEKLAKATVNLGGECT